MSSQLSSLDFPLSVAPMLDWTDRHARYFYRTMSTHTVLYTEMVTTGAILFGDAPRHLDFTPAESPVILQLGGSDPKDMARAAKKAQQWGYDAININVGCPSDRVQSGRFGACLMATPHIVADCYRAMTDACTLPVTVKTRIGIDRDDSYEPLADFVEVVAGAGCKHFIVHARKAWLDGLSPKENRDIPPLRYEYVYRLKRERPELRIEINGGIAQWEDIHTHLAHTDGVMLGRHVYHSPYFLAHVDGILGGNAKPLSDRDAVVRGMYDYIENERARGNKMWHTVRHMLGLYNGEPGARLWRQCLSREAIKPDAGPEVLEAALKARSEAAERTQRASAEYQAQGSDVSGS